MTVHLFVVSPQRYHQNSTIAQLFPPSSVCIRNSDSVQRLLNLALLMALPLLPNALPSLQRVSRY